VFIHVANISLSHILCSFFYASIGNLIGHHRDIFRRNPLFIGMRLPEAREVESLDRRYPQLSHSAMDIVKWALRLDPSDRPSCSQLLRHELFTRNGWIPKFTAELRVNIEKEFAENPLLNNLGITIYGSVHEAKLREIAEKKAHQEVAQVHSGVKSTLESKALDTASRVRRKEKKKRAKKDVFLTRDKAPRGLLTEGQALTDVSTKFPPTVSQTSLTAPVLSPLHPTSLRQLPPTPVLSSPHTFESLPPVPQIAPHTEGTPSNLTSSSTQQVYVQESATPRTHKQTAVSLTSPSLSVVNVLQSRVQPQSSFPEVFDISQYPNKLLQSSKQKRSKTKDVPLPHLHEQERVRLKISSQGALGVPMLGSKPKRNDPFADLHNPNANPDTVSSSSISKGQHCSRGVQQNSSTFNTVK
jgi:serine/threonine protein kinase